MEYVIWSIEHRAWWRPNSVGYCDTLSEAGRYAQGEAERIVARANLVRFHECMIPIDAVAGGDVLHLLARNGGLQTADLAAHARRAVAGGAGHDCEEWWDARARCALCDKPRSFTCPACGRTSHNPNDSLNQYCGECHRFFGGTPGAVR